MLLRRDAFARWVDLTARYQPVLRGCGFCARLRLAGLRHPACPERLRRGISHDAKAGGTSDTCLAPAQHDSLFLSEHGVRSKRRQRAECRGLLSSGDTVLETHDVILAQVAPRLDLYEEKRHLPHVFESMLVPIGI